MKKVHAYLIGSLMITGSVLLSQGCTRDTSSDDDLIGNWKKGDDFEEDARSEAISFTIGDYAYVGMGARGTSNSERFKDMMEYNLARRYWTQKADLPGAARSSAVAFSIGTKGYVGTGYDGSVRLNDFWEYDQALNQWTQKTSFAGTARYDAVAFVLNGKGYVGCGTDGNYLKDMWQFDPSGNGGQGSWEQKASVGGSKRSAAMAFVVNNTAYVFGGNNNGEIQQDLWAYNESDNLWEEKNKIYDATDDSFDDDYGSIARQNGVTFIIDNLVYLATGEGGSGSINSTTWRYDPTSDRWIEKTAFEGTGRTGAIAFTLQNRGFVGTGRSGNLLMDNVYEFLPNDEQVDND